MGAGDGGGRRGGSALGDLAAEAMVGRQQERRLFARYLAGARPRGYGPILNVWGPAGVGKSTLLDAFRRQALATGAAVWWSDLLDGPAARERLQQGLAAGAAGGPLVVALDSYEAAGPLDRWLREGFLAALPEAAVVVIASRAPLQRIWQHLPAWRQLVQSLPLAPFDRATTAAYLRRHGVHDPALAAAAHQATGGLPLALALALPALQQGALAVPAGAVPDPGAVAALAARWLREAPDLRLRELVEAAAVVRRFHQDLLAHLTGSPVSPAEWDRIASLSFVRPGEGGWSLHSLVRATLLRDLTWRRPDHLSALRRRALAFCAQVLAQDPPPAGWSALLADFFFLLGDALIGAAFFPAAGDGDEVQVVPATAADLPDLEAYAAACRRQAAAGPAPFQLVDPSSGTPFTYPYLWVDFTRAPLDFPALLALGPGVVRLARDSVGALRGVAVVIPVHEGTLSYLASQPVTRACIAALAPDQRQELAVPPHATAAWFIRHVHTLDLGDAAARGALLRDLFRFAFRHGRLLASSPAPFFQDLLRRCGFTPLPGATHCDFGPDLPSPTFLLDTRGDRLADLLARLIYGGAPPPGAGTGGLAATLSRRLAGWPPGGDEAAAPPADPLAGQPWGLTPREVEVCRAVLAGLANKEIAGQLGIRTLTVKKHLTHIFAKLGVASRTQLIRRVLAGARRE